MTSTMTRSAVIPIDQIVWDTNIYPRSKWDTSTVERYADAMEAGDKFPPIILEHKTDRLLDGKQRELAYRKIGATEVLVEWHDIPDGMSAKYYAAVLSARHGDRISNADLKILAEEEFEANPTTRASVWSQGLGITERTVQMWVSHITERARVSRWGKAERLRLVGWTQQEIGMCLGVSQDTISLDTKERKISDLRIPETWNEHWIADEAQRLNVPIQLMWRAAIDSLDDLGRLTKLGIKIQPYDVWNFASCHDLMGSEHPGRIPGELICHVLYFFTHPGDVVVDPMVGSGTTLDACLLMGREARGYDIDLHHDRVDIEQHDLINGWPDKTKKASLVFWDAPYFDKKDDEYVSGSISRLDPDAYLEFFEKRFTELKKMVKKDCKLAFLMSDWDSENSKNNQQHPGIFLWDYADLLRNTGWSIRRQVQVPLSSQQVHPDIVNKFRASRRLARLERYLLIAE